MNSELSGILLVDKPAGLSSQQVLTQLKKSCGFPKIGHAGTLDPFATGLLVVLIGRATRLQEFLLLDHKEYEGVILVGRRTTSDDITGSILSAEDESSIPDADLAERCTELEKLFSGTIMQVPPDISAIHVDGKRAYERARRGESLQGVLQEREVTIHTLKLSLSAPQRLSYRVHCSKGTYIRALARDIGNVLGAGACVESLRRTRSGNLSIDRAVPLSVLTAEPSRAVEFLLPGSVAVEHCARWTFCDADIELLRKGRQEPLGRLPQGQGVEIAGLFSESGVLIGVASEQVGSGWRLRLNY